MRGQCAPVVAADGHFTTVGILTLQVVRFDVQSIVRLALDLEIEVDGAARAEGLAAAVSVVLEVTEAHRGVLRPDIHLLWRLRVEPRVLTRQRHETEPVGQEIVVEHGCILRSQRSHSPHKAWGLARGWVGAEAGSEGREGRWRRRLEWGARGGAGWGRGNSRPGSPHDGMVEGRCGPHLENLDLVEGHRWHLGNHDSAQCVGDGGVRLAQRELDRVVGELINSDLRHPADRSCEDTRKEMDGRDTCGVAESDDRAAQPARCEEGQGRRAPILAASSAPQGRRQQRVDFAKSRRAIGRFRIKDPAA